MEGDPLDANPSAIEPHTLPEPGAGQPLGRRLAIHAIRFILLFVLWIILSGRFDAFHIVLGIISCLIVSRMSGDLLFTTDNPFGVLRLWLRFICYIPWLMGQIFLANLHVLYLTFHPRMKHLIKPCVIKFDSRLKSDYARTTFANSITLTPGTITVNADALGRFTVHCIDEKSSRALPGAMEEKIAWVFEE